MAASIVRSAAALAAATLLALMPTHALPAPSGIDRIVVFGTSLSDAGNAFTFLAGHPACGERLNVPPYDLLLADGMMPDGPYAAGGHHFSNGPTWVEGLAGALGLPGNARPALYNASRKASNYAVGGARAFAHDDFVRTCRINLAQQVDAYLADVPATSPATLVVIEMGSNDVRDAIVAAVTAGGDAVAMLQESLGATQQQVMRLYAAGVRRFLVANVGDLGKTPAMLAYPPVVGFLATQLSGAYSDGLAALVAALGAAGADARLLDFRGVLADVLDAPAAYGFTNVIEPCVTPGQPPFHCAQPDAYVFWDGGHPTRAMHAIVADEAIEVVEP
jgi:outer membrane lipase/esterase